MVTESLKQELDFTYKSVVDSWKVYMSWLSFVVAANLLVMGWVLTSENAPTSLLPLRLFCAVWILLDALGAVSSILLSRYSHQSATRMAKVIQELSEQEGEWTSRKPPFPTVVAVTGALFGAINLITFMAVWICILGTVAV